MAVQPMDYILWSVNKTYAINNDQKSVNRMCMNNNYIADEGIFHKCTLLNALFFVIF